jgi:hypothetical protein
VETISRTSPASSCSGLSTGIAAMVVQFGFAMMRLVAWWTSAPFTSATTSGTSGSIRHAEELSITVTPAAANVGASALELAPPAENSATSRPVGSASAASSTTTSAPCHGSVLPAERAEAKNLISSTGNERCARIRRIMVPTWPVAPTTPTFMIFLPPRGVPASSIRSRSWPGRLRQRPVPP